MNKTLSNLHKFSSSRLSALLDELNPEEWLAQPAGFQQYPRGMSVIYCWSAKI